MLTFQQYITETKAKIVNAKTLIPTETETTNIPKYLRGMKNYFEGDSIKKKHKNLVNDLQKGKQIKKPIHVKGSKIIDGHHRWAAMMIYGKNKQIRTIDN